MDKQFISLRQFLGSAILFVFGSSVVMGVNTESGRDSWISLLLASVLVLPLIIMYARLVKLHPEQNIFQMMTTVFGKVIGKIFILIFMFYCMHLASLVMVNFSKFIRIVVMPDTPEVMILILLTLPVLYIAKSGIKVLGKWSSVSCMLVALVVFLTIIMSINIFEIDNIVPVLATDASILIRSSIKITALPFGEIVMFLVIADSIAKKISSYKAFILGLYTSALLLLLIVLRNTLTLGTMMEKIYFPSFTQAKIIRLSDSFERIEGLISFNFILAGITKITVCAIALSKGFSVLFDSDDYTKFVFPSCYLILSIALILYENIMQMFEFINIYHYYAVWFQLAIPAVLLLFSEIRRIRHPSKSGAAAENSDNNESDNESESAGEYESSNESDEKGKDSIYSGENAGKKDKDSNDGGRSSGDKGKDSNNSGRDNGDKGKDSNNSGRNSGEKGKGGSNSGRDIGNLPDDKLRSPAPAP